MIDILLIAFCLLLPVGVIGFLLFKAILLLLDEEGYSREL